MHSSEKARITEYVTCSNWDFSHRNLGCWSLDLPGSSLSVTVGDGGR